MEDSLAASEGCKKRYLSLGSCAQGILHWPACIITILLSLSLWSYAIAAAPLFLLLLLKCQQVSWWCDGETWVLVYLIFSSLSLHINLFFSRSYSAQMASPTLLLERLFYTVTHLLQQSNNTRIRLCWLIFSPGSLEMQTCWRAFICISSWRWLKPWERTDSLGNAKVT